MGNRAFIQIESRYFPEPVVFYGHWSGDHNITAVKNVLARTDRVGDPEYLAAQVFYEFTTLAGYDGNLSFGISSGKVIDEEAWTDNPTVILNADTGVATVDGKTI